MKKRIYILGLLSLFCLIAATTMTVHTTEGDLEFELDEITSITFTDNPVPEGMVFVEGGTFQMGDRIGNGYGDELPLHDVAVSSFFIGQYEVTQGEYEEIMGNNPAHNYGEGGNYPVYYVSWYDAVAYCNVRSTVEGLTPCYSGTICNFNANGYRLPTEAEWEYAARGGIQQTDNFEYSGSNTIGNVSWYGYYDNPQGTAIEENTYPVGTKAPNQLDIYDMSGNVCEWCGDWYADYDSISQTNPTGPATGSIRVLRGGSWYNYADDCRVADRYYNYQNINGYYIGFRVVRRAD